MTHFDIPPWATVLLPWVGFLIGALYKLWFGPSREEERERWYYEQQMKHNEEYLNEKP